MRKEGKWHSLFIENVKHDGMIKDLPGVDKHKEKLFKIRDRVQFQAAVYIHVHDAHIQSK